MLIICNLTFLALEAETYLGISMEQMIDKIIVTRQFISISKKAPQVLFMFVYYPCFL